MLSDRAWLEVTVAAPPGSPAELAAQALVDAGAAGIEERPPLADGRAVLVAYLPAGRLPLDAAPLAVLSAVVTGTHRIADRDWEAEWRGGLLPIPLGTRLVVLPTSPPAKPLSGRLAIRLDPGGAFGTGLHPTTVLAAEALEAAMGGRAGGPPSVLDVGTGSGVLAIAAYLLGARPVLAIDNDPEAVDEAWKNARRNGCRDAFEASDRPLEAIEARYDLVVANLDGPSLSALGERLGERVAAGGELIVSGLRAGEPWPGPGPLVIRETTSREGWRCERWGR